MTINNVSGSCILPVELLYFTAVVNHNIVELNWQTGSKKNNSGFEIQRSSDGIHWKSIDFVPGNGTTQNVQNYTFIDEQPLLGLNYYRLKQIDFDWIFEYSSIVSVEMNTSIYTAQIFPNPTYDDLTIVLNSNQNTPKLYIINVLGETLQSYPIHNNKEQISLSSFPDGAYIIQLHYSHFVESYKIIKQ